MREYGRRLITTLALLAGAVLIWYVGNRLLELTGAMIDRVGPIWSLIILAGATVVLTTVWIRYGGAGALGRWGVTIKPATPPADASRADGRDEGADVDLPGTAGRRGPGTGH
jgi:hypothetical protein